MKSLCSTSVRQNDATKHCYKPKKCKKRIIVGRIYHQNKEGTLEGRLGLHYEHGRVQPCTFGLEPAIQSSLGIALTMSSTIP